MRRERESWGWGGREPTPGPPLEVAPSCPRMAPHTLLCVPSNPSGKISSQSSCSPERAQHAHHASQTRRSPSRGSFHDPLTACGAAAATSVPTSGLRLPRRAAHQVSAAHGHDTAGPGPPSTGAEPARCRSLVPPASAREGAPRPAGERQPPAPTGRQRPALAFSAFLAGIHVHGTDPCTETRMLLAETD